MDLPCPKCGEPWDFDTLHEVADETGQGFAKVHGLFRSQGCGAAFHGSSYAGPCHADKHAAVRFAMAELAGDDADGYASDMEDLGHLLA